MKKRLVGAIVGALAMTFALGACSAEEPAPVVVTETPQADPEKVDPPEPVVPDPIVWPLTGVPVEEVAVRPALGIKIENSRQSRPWTGLEYADIVRGSREDFDVLYKLDNPDKMTFRDLLGAYFTYYAILVYLALFVLMDISRL